MSELQWEHRKGWDILLDAFWSEFGKGEPVELMLITYVPSWEHGPRSVEVCIRSRATLSADCARKSAREFLTSLPFVFAQERIRQHALLSSERRKGAWKLGRGSKSGRGEELPRPRDFLKQSPPVVVQPGGGLTRAELKNFYAKAGNAMQYICLTSQLRRVYRVQHSCSDDDAFSWRLS